jgi:hypothetical protein
VTHERIERTERRFVVGYPAPVLEALADLPCSKMQYRVRSVYLDSIRPVRLRLREYDESGAWWLEQKLDRGHSVLKIRQHVGAIDSSLLEPIVEVRYARAAYTGSSWRITVDVDVTSGSRTLPFTVVEVKASALVEPPIALPPEDLAFSKFRWARGAYHVQRALVSATGEN